MQWTCFTAALILAVCVRGALPCQQWVVLATLFPCVQQFAPNFPFLALLQSRPFSIDGFVITLCQGLSQDDLTGLVGCTRQQTNSISCDHPIINMLQIVTPENVIGLCNVTKVSYTCSNGTTALFNSKACTDTYQNLTASAQNGDICGPLHQLYQCLNNSTSLCSALRRLQVFDEVGGAILRTHGPQCGQGPLTQPHTTADPFVTAGQTPQAPGRTQSTNNSPAEVVSHTVGIRAGVCQVPLMILLYLLR